MKPAQPVTGTVEHCTETRDGRFFVVISAGRHKAHGYASAPVNVGSSATIAGERVQ